MRDEQLKRINIGCGQSPTPGWLNYDNSLSIRLVKLPVIGKGLRRFKVLRNSKSFISFAEENHILWADAAIRIPQPDDSAEVIYSSHMIEHLDRQEVRQFFQEASRVLVSKGVIRIAVPDLRKMINQYITDGDADSFIEKTLLARQRTKSLFARLRYLIVGDRHHLWMYDGSSVCKLLTEFRFRNPIILTPGETTIPNLQGLNLFERADESIYIEAFNE